MTHPTTKSKQEYRIRVKPMVPWPGGKEHGASSTPPADFSEYQIVLGKAIKPTYNWRCGTDVVWRVSSLVDPSGTILLVPKETAVCRHQIQIGD